MHLAGDETLEQMPCASSPGLGAAQLTGQNIPGCSGLRMQVRMAERAALAPIPWGLRPWRRSTRCPPGPTHLTKAQTLQFLL